MRTVRRAISLDTLGLFPVATHAHVTGKEIISVWPSRRSSHVVAVIAADTAAESSRRRRLSIRMTEGPVAILAVILLRHSSSSRPSVILSRFRPIAALDKTIDQQRGTGSRSRFLE